MTTSTPQPSTDSCDISAGSPDLSAWMIVAEIGLIVAIFFLYSSAAPPDVNEAHYLAKAKHYWNPSWCDRDLFLRSADAHLVFYWTFGWLTQWLSLSAVAWIGRIITWIGIAWTWQRLSWSLQPTRLTAVLSAAIFLSLLHWCHLAGEWVIGGVEAKGFAYIFVLIGLRQIVVGKWRRGPVAFGIASAFHVLVGGWSVIAGGFAWLLSKEDRPSWQQMLPALVIGLVCALPGLLPAVALTRGVSAEVTRDANLIYVFGRLSHHLVFHRFAHTFMIRHGLLLVMWGALWWTSSRWWMLPTSTMQARLQRFVAGAVLLGIVGVGIDQSLLSHPDIAAKLLRYYWFRLSDVMLPIGTALAVVSLLNTEPWRRRSMAPLLRGATLIAATVGIGLVHWQHVCDHRPRADRQSLPTDPQNFAQSKQLHADWVAACRWIDENTASDVLFLTPRHQQTFKWYASRAELVNWKDVPQDAATLREWWTIQHKVYPRGVVRYGLAAWGVRHLTTMGRKYDADYILLRRNPNTAPIHLPRVYPNRFAKNDSYAIYVVPPAGVGKATVTDRAEK